MHPVIILLWLQKWNGFQSFDLFLKKMVIAVKCPKTVPINKPIAPNLNIPKIRFILETVAEFDTR